MAEIVGIIGSVVGILTAAEVAYQKIKSLKGLPEAFAEVALRLPLAQQILRAIETQSRNASNEVATALLPVIKSCKGNSDTLKTTLEKLDPGESASAWSVDRYISLIKSRGKKGRVEDLMKKVLEDIYTLASHKAINAATSEELTRLMDAIEKVGNKKSVPDELLQDDAGVSISQGANGSMSNQVGDYTTAWNNFGSGAINNIGGDAHFGATSDQRRRDILRALNCASYEDHKNRNPEAMPKTCEWFTEHPTFRAWVIDPDERFLWVSADPGCGKSVLARYMIDHKLKTSRVIYFFFKDGLDDQDNAESALKCLLHQLLVEGSHIFTEEILGSFEELGKDRYEGFSALWNIFAKVSRNATNTICILDALDECKTVGWSRLAKALGGLYGNDNTHMRFIMFSRPYNQVRRAIRQGRIPHINLRGEDEVEVSKISAEINVVIKKKIKDLVLESKISLEEQDKVVRRLTKVNNRTYLWIHVICDMLENLERVENNSLERFLDRLPETVEDAYEKILGQSVDAQIAKTLLHIVVAAARPLSVEEMAIAMAVNGHQSFDGEFSVMRTDLFVEGMRNICGLFVVVIEKKVHLIHQTAREFLIRDVPSARSLKWEACLDLEESNRILTRICVWYLLNIGLQRPLSMGPTRRALVGYSKIYVMFDYASRYWTSHYRQSKMEESLDFSRDMVQLFDTSWTGCITWYSYFMDKQNSSVGWLNSDPLLLAASLGIGHVVKDILAEGKYRLHARDVSHFRSALYWSARSGCHDVVVILLEMRNKREIFMDYERLDIGKSLIVASQNGHVSIVETLLKVGKAKLSQKDAKSALSTAASLGSNSIVRLLLSSKFDHEIKVPQPQWKKWLQMGQSNDQNEHDLYEHHQYDRYMYGRHDEYRSPLSSAADHGHLATVRLLLESGKISPDSKDWTDQTPLSYAAKSGYTDVVKILLDTGKVDVNSRNNIGKTPLSHAVRYGHAKIVKMLLDTSNIDVNPREYLGKTPLSLAVTFGYTNIVKMLLETGDVEFNTRDNHGNTPISLAVKKGNLAVVEMLLATGKAGDMKSRNLEDKKPLAIAMMEGLPRVVNSLVTSRNILEERPDPELISSAAAKDDLSIVMLLHEEGNAELGMTDTDILDGGAIMVALENGSKKVFEYLLDAGKVDVNVEFNWKSRTSNTHRSTLLTQAVASGRPDIVRILLSRKADVNLKSGEDGATALSTAVACGRLDIVKALLRAEGLDLSLRCQDDLTTRLIARKLHARYSKRRHRQFIKHGYIFREIIFRLNWYIFSLWDHGEALQSMERSITEKRDTEVWHSHADLRI